MTPRGFISSCRDRGVNLRVEGRKLVAAGLTKEDRAFLRRNAGAVMALLELDAGAEGEGVESEGAQVAVVAEVARRSARRKRQYRLHVMATWGPEKVERLAEAGRLTAEDIRDWRAARRELERRRYLRVIGAGMAGVTGRSIRIVEE